MRTDVFKPTQFRKLVQNQNKEPLYFTFKQPMIPQTGTYKADHHNIGNLSTKIHESPWTVGFTSTQDTYIRIVFTLMTQGGTYFIRTPKVTLIKGRHISFSDIYLMITTS